MGLLDPVVAQAKSSFGAVKELGGFSGGAQPQMHYADLDQGTKDLMAQRSARAARSNEDVAAEATKGTGAASSMNLSPERMQQSSSALGMADQPGLRQALQNRSQRAFDSNMGNIQAQARAQAPLTKFNDTSLAGNEMMAQNAINNQNIVASNQAFQNKLAARNQVISSVLGAVGTGVGAYAGGATGAKAGGQMGSSMAGNTQMGYVKD